MRRKGLLADKPVVAVGAGATAVLGASSLSKIVPASTLIKFTTCKVPAAFKLGLAQLQRISTMGLSNFMNPFEQGLASAGAKSSTMKLTTSAAKIRAVTHTIIASTERISLLGMRTSFTKL